MRQLEDILDELQLKQLVTALLNNEQNLPYLSQSKSYFGIFHKTDPVVQVVKEIEKSLKDKTAIEKSQIITQLSNIISERITANRSEQQLHIAKRLKESLGGKGWKAKLLGLKHEKFVNEHYLEVKLESSPDVLLRITDTKRFHAYPKESMNQDNYFVLMGSTFFNSKLEEKKSEKVTTQTSHIMDAVYGAYSIYKQNRPQLAIAIADGCGGHMGDQRQDRVISRVAYFAAKSAVRLMLTFDDADLLLKNKQQLFEKISKEISHKLDGYYEGTTLIAVKTFTDAKGIRLIAFGVGDCLLVSWNPGQQILKTLLPAQQSMLGQMASPAMLPTGYKPEEIQAVDTIVSPGTILLPMSDGLFEDLPCQERIITSTSNAKVFREIHLDSDKLIPLLAKLPLNTSVRQILATLTEFAIDNANSIIKEKFRKAEQAIKIYPQVHAELQQVSKQYGNRTADISAKDKKSNDEVKIKLEKLREQDYQLRKDMLIKYGDDLSAAAVKLK
jgi:hypothetical protein